MKTLYLRQSKFSQIVYWSCSVMRAKDKYLKLIQVMYSCFQMLSLSQEMKSLSHISHLNNSQTMWINLGKIS
jgi:hypothetical protein